MRGREEGGTVVSNQCIQSETGITSLKGDADVEAGFIILNKTRHCSRYHNCNLTSEGRQIYCDIEVGDRSQFYMHVSTQTSVPSCSGLNVISGLSSYQKHSAGK